MCSTFVAVCVCCVCVCCAVRGGGRGARARPSQRSGGKGEGGGSISKRRVGWWRGGTDVARALTFHFPSRNRPWRAGGPPSPSRHPPHTSLAMSRPTSLVTVAVAALLALACAAPGVAAAAAPTHGAGGLVRLSWPPPASPLQLADEVRVVEGRWTDLPVVWRVVGRGGGGHRGSPQGRGGGDGVAACADSLLAEEKKNALSPLPRPAHAPAPPPPLDTPAPSRPHAPSHTLPLSHRSSPKPRSTSLPLSPRAAR